MVTEETEQEDKQGEALPPASQHMEHREHRRQEKIVPLSQVRVKKFFKAIKQTLPPAAPTLSSLSPTISLPFSLLLYVDVPSFPTPPRMPPSPYTFLIITSHAPSVPTPLRTLFLFSLSLIPFSFYFFLQRTLSLSPLCCPSSLTFLLIFLTASFRFLFHPITTVLLPYLPSSHLPPCSTHNTVAALFLYFWPLLAIVILCTFVYVSMH